MAKTEIWQSIAPSNIALIKYMGKADIAGDNIGLNDSLSYTCTRFKTCARCVSIPGSEDQWHPIDDRQYCYTPNNTSAAGDKMVRHIARIKAYYGYDGAFAVTSGNNFPADCGIASSASAFCAVTQCVQQAIIDLQGLTLSAEQGLADRILLSRQGSGSACRSNVGPWAWWRQERVRPLELMPLLHEVVLIDDGPKSISSSQAHRMVLTSPHFQGRRQRAQQRLRALIGALRHQWRQAHKIAWDEFEDMHTLFHQCTPSFTFMNEANRRCLAICQQYWQDHHTGPLVTMDAGSNVHLFFRHEDQQHRQQLLSQLSSFTLL